MDEDTATGQVERGRHRENNRSSKAIPSILGVVFTARELIRDTARYTDPVEGHVVEKQGMEEVAIVGKGSYPFSIPHGKVICLNAVAGKEYLVPFQPEGVGPETQIEGQVIHTEIRTVSNDDKCSEILMPS